MRSRKDLRQMPVHEATPAGPGRALDVFFSPDALEEIKREAIRLDRSLSWIVQRAWLLAHKAKREG